MLPAESLTYIHRIQHVPFELEGEVTQLDWETICAGLAEFSIAIDTTGRLHVAGQNRFRHLNSIAVVRNAADQTGLAVNVWTTVTFDTEDVDTDGIHAGGNPTRLTAAIPGKYLVIGEMYMDGSATVVPTELDCRILLNAGTTNIQAQHTVAPPSNGPLAVIGVTCLLSLAATDYVEFQGLVGASSGTWDIGHSTNHPNRTFFSMAYLGE